MASRLVDIEANRDPVGGPRDWARDVGRRIQLVREALGWSGAELARRLRVNRSNVTRIEAGQWSPTLRTLYRIAVAFQVEPSQLVPPMETEPGEGGPRARRRLLITEERKTASKRKKTPRNRVAK